MGCQSVVPLHAERKLAQATFLKGVAAFLCHQSELRLLPNELSIKELHIARAGALLAGAEQTRHQLIEEFLF